MSLPDLAFKRSTVTRYDTAGERLAYHRRARFIVSNGEARIQHGGEEPDLVATIADGDKVGARQVVLTTTDGERWVANLSGCGCGGS